MPQSSSTARASKFIELRPKEDLLITFTNDSSPIDFRRRKHALSQKSQRDRLKVAFDQVALVLSTNGVNSGRKGGLCTKVELLETAVGYIQHLQSELSQLRQEQQTKV